jgi:negative regulator of flagellin synthesis FlgM
VKIDTSLIPGSTPAIDNRPRAQVAAKKQAAATDVQISDLSTHLQAIEESAGDASPVNSNRVAEIKQAIAEGRFTINSSAIADRLIGTAVELLQSNRRKA